MNIDNLLSKHSDNYRFHGVRELTEIRLIAQSDGPQITLWGRVEDEDGRSGYEQGAGELSVTDISDMEMSFNEFCDEGGLVLVLEKAVSEPAEAENGSDRRERMVRCEEWTVIGGLRPVFDEDEEVIDQEAFSLEEIAEM